jgi:hypothetical protein
MARFGSSRRAIALGLIAASMLTGAVLAALGGAIIAIVAHDASAPPAPIDALTCTWIGVLAGSAYAAMFALGATFGARGGGRFWALVLDFVLAGTGTFAAVLVPHPHARNLLGGEPPLLFTQPLSMVSLLVLAAGFTALAIARTAP